MVPIAQRLVHWVVVPAIRVRFPLGTPAKTPSNSEGVFARVALNIYRAVALNYGHLVSIDKTLFFCYI